jgi:hypothetical protein
MTENDAPVKDPVSPNHKRFVLTQASLRLWIMAAVVVLLGLWLALEL